MAGSKYKLETLLKKLSDFKGKKISEFVSYLQDLNKNTQDESQDFAAASSSSSKTPSKAGGDQLSAKQQLPAAQQPAAAPAHQAAEEVPMSQVSQDEWGLPKVPFASQASCSDLEVEKPLPISKQTIRQEKGMKRPAGAKRPASAMAKRPSCNAVDTRSEHEEPGTTAATASMDCPAPALLLTCATQQSYICCKEDGKKKLWVSITKSMSENHQDLMRKIFSYNPKSKAQSLELRAKLLAEEG